MACGSQAAASHSLFVAGFELSEQFGQMFRYRFNLSDSAEFDAEMSRYFRQPRRSGQDGMTCGLLVSTHRPLP